jgi:hypothetical protein
MEHVGNPLIYVAAYTFAIFATPYLHEGSHWAVGKLGGTDPTVDWKIARYVWPEAVWHGEIDTMDSILIQLSGFSIFLWVPPWVVSLPYLVSNPTPLTMLASLLPFLTVFAMTTESDVIAIRDPEEFREQAMERNLSGEGVFNQTLVAIVFLAVIVYPMLPL